MMESSIGTSMQTDENTNQFSRVPLHKRAISGLTIPKYKGERCIFEDGETYSPGPARYSMAEA